MELMLVHMKDSKLFKLFYMDHDTLMDLSDLVRDNKRHEQAQLDLFKEILKKCHNIIKRKNNEGFRHAIYDIPPIMWGKPKYDICALRNYLLMHLHENGLYVDMLPNGRSIYICWDEKVLDLDKFYKHKARIEHEYNQHMLGQNHTVSRDTMEFRQKKQRELQEQRNRRLQLQKSRFMHLEKDNTRY